MYESPIVCKATEFQFYVVQILQYGTIPSKKMKVLALRVLVLSWGKS